MEAESRHARHAPLPMSLDNFDTFDRPPPMRLSLGTTSKMLIVMVWMWALVETRWELLGETRITPVLALFVAKLIFTAIVLGTLKRVPAALVLFSFCCAVSIIVIAMTMPRMYTIAPLYFRLELVETVLKTAAVIALVFDYLNEDRAAETWQTR
jgi:hypothetical protein